MRVLITGGAGFIGSHIVDLLIKRAHSVLVIDDFSTGRWQNLESTCTSGNVLVLQEDITNLSALSAACVEFSPAVVIHLAALVSVPHASRHPEENFRLNVASTHNVCIAASAARVRRVIFASSAAVYGNNDRIPLKETEILAPLSLYGGAKAASECLLRAAGLELGFESVALRFFNVFGIRQRPDSSYSGVISIFADRIQRNLPLIIHGDGRQSRDFIPVCDVAIAVVTVAEASRPLTSMFNVCTGHQTTILDLVGAFEKVVGRQVDRVLADDRNCDIRFSCGAPSALAATVGFSPTTSLHDGLVSLLQRSSSGQPGPVLSSSPYHAVPPRPPKRAKFDGLDSAAVRHLPSPRRP